MAPDTPAAFPNPRLLFALLCFLQRLVISGGLDDFDYGKLISNVDEYCYEAFVKDSSCCLDQILAGGVHMREVHRPNTSWSCEREHKCWDAKLGPRGVGSMWIPEGANCRTPRILYVHGGSWEYGSPFTDSYPQLTSRIANLTGFIVYSIDYPLAPVGNFSVILQAALDGLEWLARHGATNGEITECGMPVPPLFIGGDSSGGGSALSTVMKINQEPSLGPLQGRVPLAGAFFFSPWTNLECNTPDYYHHAFAKIVTRDDMGGRTAYVGDLMFRGHPLVNKDAFTGNAQDYIGNDPSLLKDPIASPLHSTASNWRDVPPLYFAVGGSESILGDSVLFAQKASHNMVEVQLDVYQGMWHVFPMYTEGCGSGRPLWQGVSALRRMAKFAVSIAYTGRPACSTHPGIDGDVPYTEFHYNNPKKDVEWFPSEDSCAHLFKDWEKHKGLWMEAPPSTPDAYPLLGAQNVFGLALLAVGAFSARLLISNRQLREQLRTARSGGYLQVHDEGA